MSITIVHRPDEEPHFVEHHPPPEPRSSVVASPTCMTVPLDRHPLELASHVHVMGILNVTPDSFSDGGRFDAPKHAVERALALQDAGADLIDVGGESTRPGAEPVSEEEELRRVVPVVEALSDALAIAISVDTTKARVAEAALAAGAEIVNDISGLRFDGAMAGVVARRRAGCVLMHTPGRPRTMNDSPQYADVVEDVRAYLAESIRLAEEAGVDPELILVDPGIGFGKRPQHDLELHRRLSELASLGKPILFGPSRKSFLGRILALPVDQRVEGTIASCCIAALAGARMVRVHDVAAVKRAMRVIDALDHEWRESP